MDNWTLLEAAPKGEGGWGGRDAGGSGREVAIPWTLGGGGAVTLAGAGVLPDGCAYERCIRTA